MQLDNKRICFCFLFSRDKNSLRFPASVTLSSRYYSKIHNLMFVIHCCIFRFKEPSSGITLEKLKKEQIPKHVAVVNKRYISPVTGPRCPGGSRKLRFPDYVTVAQDGGKVVSLTHRPLLTPRKYSWYSFHVSG